MKLAVITDEISMDLEHALDVMREYGVERAELRSVWDTNITDMSDDDVARAKRIIADKGFKVCCIASPFFKCELYEESAETTGMTHQAKTRGLSEQKTLLERCFRLADTFGTNLIRVFSFWRHGDMTPEIQRHVVDAFTEPVAMAEKDGKILVLENEHACYLGTGVETAAVLKQVNSPWLRAVWDPGNALCAGEVPYPDGYQAIKNYTVHVHLKDARRGPGGKIMWTVIGEGDIDYRGQFVALKKAGYDGYLSLETHYVPEGGTKEEGSRQCLASLRKMVG